MTCRTCVYLDLPTDKNGRRYSRPDGAYRCLAPVGEPPPLPHSVTGAFPPFKWPPARAYVTVRDGEGCPLHKTKVPIPTWLPSPNIMPTQDEELGMLWWNRISEEKRNYWLKVADSAVPALAWAAWKRKADYGDGS